MKKSVALFVVAALFAFLMSACGGGSASSSSAVSSSSKPASSSSVAPQSTPAEAASIEQIQEYSLDFNLINHSNAALVDIRLSSSDEATFGENLLPEGYVLPNGSNVDILFDTTAPAGTTYDMYTEDEDGDQYEYYDIPLTQITELALYVEFFDDGTYNNYYEYA